MLKWNYLQWQFLISKPALFNTFKTNHIIQTIQVLEIYYRRNVTFTEINKYFISIVITSHFWMGISFKQLLWVCISSWVCEFLSLRPWENRHVYSGFAKTTSRFRITVIVIQLFIIHLKQTVSLQVFVIMNLLN